VVAPSVRSDQARRIHMPNVWTQQGPITSAVLPALRWGIGRSGTVGLHVYASLPRLATEEYRFRIPMNVPVAHACCFVCFVRRSAHSLRRTLSPEVHLHRTAPPWGELLSARNPTHRSLQPMELVPMRLPLHMPQVPHTIGSLASVPRPTVAHSIVALHGGCTF
jgi:hypothetical protein